MVCFCASAIVTLTFLVIYILLNPLTSNIAQGIINNTDGIVYFKANGQTFICNSLFRHAMQKQVIYCPICPFICILESEYTILQIHTLVCSSLVLISYTVAKLTQTQRSCNA